MLRRYRRKYLTDPALDEREVVLLRDNLGLWNRLGPSRRLRTAQLARVLIKEKHWEGCGSLDLTDDMKLVIAVQAAVLLAGMDPPIDPHEDPVYPNVQTILVYPEGFVATLPRLGAAGVVTEGDPHLGEAHYQGLASGPVIVSWRHALEGALDASDGRNLVIHEFAHKLDFLDGTINGTPPLQTSQQRAEWKRVMEAHFHDLVRRASAGAPSLLDYYGATNPAEFFAVASEAYFERAEEMRQVLPDLWRVLNGYYGNLTDEPSV